MGERRECVCVCCCCRREDVEAGVVCGRGGRKALAMERRQAKMQARLKVREEKDDMLSRMLWVWVCGCVGV